MGQLIQKTIVIAMELYRITFQRGCGETGTLMNHLWEYKMVQTLWQTVGQLLRSPPYDPAILLLYILYFKRKKNMGPYKNLHINVHSSIIHNIPKLE